MQGGTHTMVTSFLSPGRYAQAPIRRDYTEVGDMAREPEELTEMRRTLGAQLTTCRIAAELTQGQLAKAAFLDRTSVNHIEKGRTPGNHRFWTIADERCRADGVLLATFHALQAAKHEHEARIREAQLAEVRAKADALRATALSLVGRLDRPVTPETSASDALPAGTVEGNPCPATAEDQSMKRREAMGLAAKIAVGAGLTAADRAVLDAPVGSSPVPARIGQQDVARVEEMTRVFMARDKAMGGGSCRDAVLGYLNWAEQLRRSTVSDSVRRSLNAALARLQNLAGWTSKDLCLFDSAARCDLRSLESAQLAEQPLLAAHALESLGDLHLLAGDYRETVRLCRLGTMPAQDAASHGMLAGIAFTEARAYASLGNAEEVQRALRRAEDEYARLHDQPDQWIIGAAVLPDQSELPAGRANAYSRLAAHNQRFAETAVTDMTEALTLRDPSRARAMLWGRITLATNQYRCGETDLANTSTEQVLATIGQVNSPRTTRDMVALGTEIRRHTTDSTALNLAHRINTEIAA